MSGALELPPAAETKENPEALVLRGKPRPAVRFRRGLIVGISGAVAVALVTVSWLALQPPSFRKAASSIDGDARPSALPPEALANVPKSYGDVPRLGPPLPGDLGRAILDHERSQEQPIPPSFSGSTAQPPDGQSAADVERERAGAARSAARTAGLMVRLGAGEQQPAATVPASLAEAAGRPLGSEPATAVPAAQQHKIAFAEGEGGFASPNRLVPASSPWTLSAGTIIPASLVTGLNSDLPGMVLAQVTENVRDSATGRTILVPQGARLIGKYDSVVAFGQRRALLIWTRLILPDGASVELDHMPATDAGGYSGVSDGVNSHTWQLLKGIGMATLLGVGTQLSFGGGSDLIRALRESAQENAAYASDQITSRNLDIQPTITVRPGWPVRALVSKDLVLQPWRG